MLVPVASLVTCVDVLDISSAKQGSAVKSAAVRNVIGAVVFIVISPVGCNGRGRSTAVNCSPFSSRAAYTGIISDAYIADLITNQWFVDRERLQRAVETVAKFFQFLLCCFFRTTVTFL